MTSASASRVTRSRHSLRLALLAFAGVLAVVTVLRAQETSPAPAAAPPVKEAIPAIDPAAKPATPPASKGPTPARFEPTEKVRADFDVSFPVDI
jgi:hypothetical protein